MGTTWQVMGRAACLALFATAASAQTLVYTLEGPNADGFALALDTVGDQDGDGVNDLLVGSPNDSTMGSHAGLAAVYSGRSGLRIRRIYGAHAEDFLGAAVAGVGDIDHDGVADLLVGSPGASSGASDSGLAMIDSGATGLPLREHSWPFADEGFGRNAWNIGDVDGDGVADYGIASTIDLDIFDPPDPELLCFSGAHGTELSALHAFDPRGLAAAGDTSGDGKKQLLEAHFMTAQLLSGTNGGVLDAGPPTSSDSVPGVGPAGDFDGDGLNDYVLASGPVSGVQYIQIRSKPHGVLFSLQLQLATSPLGLAAAFDGTADVNHDGVRDLIVGFPNANIATAPLFAGAVRIFSGTTGQVIAELHGQEAFEAFGSAVRVLGDINGDGFPEFAVSAPANTGSSNAPGRIRVFTFGSVPWSHTGSPLAGTGGVPTLAGTGPLVAGTKLTVSLAGALQGAQAVLFVGLSLIDAPFKGGVLGPSPDIPISPVTVSGNAMPLIDATWPAGVPAGLHVNLQAWIKDAAGPAGFAATDTLVATTPP